MLQQHCSRKKICSGMQQLSASTYLSKKIKRLGWKWVSAQHQGFRKNDIVSTANKEERSFSSSGMFALNGCVFNRRRFRHSMCVTLTNGVTLTVFQMWNGLYGQSQFHRVKCVKCHSFIADWRLTFCDIICFYNRDAYVSGRVRMPQLHN